LTKSIIASLFGAGGYPDSITANNTHEHGARDSQHKEGE